MIWPVYNPQELKALNTDHRFPKVKTRKNLRNCLGCRLSTFQNFPSGTEPVLQTKISAEIQYKRDRMELIGWSGGGRARQKQLVALSQPCSDTLEAHSQDP